MIAEEKKALRKQILALRNQIPQTERMAKSRQILHTLYQSEIYQNADIILTYIEYQSEVLTSPLIQKNLTKKRIFVPKVSGQDMEFYPIESLSELVKGFKGIREPRDTSQPFLEDFLQNRKRDSRQEPVRVLMLMPGAVFDKYRHRIGYGLGFYDRYLARLNDSGVMLKRVALCFACQMLNTIPHDVHDIRPDMVITENKVYQ
ncbi:MAG: 5-formyltetrahydrofolate cyclo-ligase [Roseburia sp.]|nr:5-formyltetrahydrofolate cyclo-ligase [Roseburia sp.]MCM1243155.1 5-formyltetrahydrofolate cyclo-ligase [Roseburia sp.]